MPLQPGHPAHLLWLHNHPAMNDGSHSSVGQMYQDHSIPALPQPESFSHSLWLHVSLVWCRPDLRLLIGRLQNHSAIILPVSQWQLLSEDPPQLSHIPYVWDYTLNLQDLFPCSCRQLQAAHHQDESEYSDEINLLHSDKSHDSPCPWQSQTGP